MVAIEHESQNPDFWNDNRRAKEKQSQVAAAKQDIATQTALDEKLGDLKASAEILDAEEDALHAGRAGQGQGRAA